MADGTGRSAAAAAAEQVKAIVEAAERSAAELETTAREEADRIRTAAREDTERARRAVEGLGGRVDELERRLDELMGAVQSSVAELKRELGALREAGSAPVAEQPAAEEAPAEQPPAEEAPVEEAEVAKGPPVENRGAPEGARLLALKMALDGAPRDETARYLQENFDLEDSEGLLDEVYAKAGR